MVEKIEMDMKFREKIQAVLEQFKRTNPMDFYIIFETMDKVKTELYPEINK